MVEELNSGLPRTNPDSGRVEDLNQGLCDLHNIMIKSIESYITLKNNMLLQGLKNVKFDSRQGFDQTKAIYF